MTLLSLMIPSKNEFDNSVLKLVQSPGYSQLKNGFTDLIENVKNALSELFLKLLKRIFNSAETASSVSDMLSSIFIIIGILAIITVVVVIIVKVNKTLERKRKVREILGERIDEKTTPNSLRQKAQDFIKTEDYRQAIRYDFIALLLLMHEYNVVYLDETKTNEEIYRYLEKKDFSMIDGFRCLIESFNAAWYGHRLYDKDTYKSWTGYVEAIWNEVIKHEIKEK